MDFKKMGAEFVGTAVLVIGGVCAAVFAGKDIGTLGIAFAFGLTLTALAYALGPISGAHVNPAVTLGFVLSGRMKVGLGLQYWVAQFLGGVLGAALVVVVKTQVSGVDQKQFGTNGFEALSQTKASIGGAFFIEILATFLFVFIVLSATSRIANPSLCGLAIGFALTVAHLIAIPVTGAGLNPARSLGPAIFAGGEALTQVWVFLVSPLLGALLASLVHALVTTERRTRVEEPAPAKPAPAKVPAKARRR